MPPVGFEPTISAGKRPQAARLLIYIYIYIYDISSLRVKRLKPNGSFMHHFNIKNPPFCPPYIAAFGMELR